MVEPGGGTALIHWKDSEVDFPNEVIIWHLISFSLLRGVRITALKKIVVISMNAVLPNIAIIKNLFSSRKTFAIRFYFFY